MPDRLRHFPGPDPPPDQKCEKGRGKQQVEPKQRPDLRGSLPGRGERHGLGDDAMGLPEADQNRDERHDRKEARNPVDEPRDGVLDVCCLCGIDLRADAAREHPRVRVQEPPRRIMGWESPDEDQERKEPQPVAPCLEAARQGAVGHVGEQVARLGRHQEQEHAGEDADRADPAGDQYAPRPRRIGQADHELPHPRRRCSVPLGLRAVNGGMATSAATKRLGRRLLHMRLVDLGGRPMRRGPPQHS